MDLKRNHQKPFNIILLKVLTFFFILIWYTIKNLKYNPLFCPFYVTYAAKTCAEKKRKKTQRVRAQKRKKKYIVQHKLNEPIGKRIIENTSANMAPIILLSHYLCVCERVCVCVRFFLSNGIREAQKKTGPESSREWKKKTLVK